MSFRKPQMCTLSTVIAVDGDDARGGGGSRR